MTEKEAVDALEALDDIDYESLSKTTVQKKVCDR